MKNTLSLILFAMVFTASAQTDTITIGKQTWMAKNLDVSTFNNGDPIPQAKTNAAWIAADKNKKPAWCYYKNDPKNGATYGKLYNYYAVTDKRGLVPKGWRLPSGVEWNALNDFLGTFEEANAKIKYTQGWNDNGNGTNESGFAALPGGGRNSKGEFGGLGNYAHWWTCTEKTPVQIYVRYIGSKNAFVSYMVGNAGDGLSIRCLR